MHPLVPAALALLCVNASPGVARAAPLFLVLTLASVAWRTVGNLLLLAFFGAHIVGTTSQMNTGTVPAIVFAALAPVDAALTGTSLSLLRSALRGLRTLALLGGVIETLFARRRLLAMANNVASMALAAWAPAEITVSYVFFAWIVPGTLYLSAKRRGITGTAGRAMLFWCLFEALAAHEYGYELCISIAVAISA